MEKSRYILSNGERTTYKKSTISYKGTCVCYTVFTKSFMSFISQYSMRKPIDTWFAMEKLVEKGLAKDIGLSNFNSVQIQEVLDKGKVRISSRH